MQAENEMGVIVEFAQHCEQAGWEIVRINGGYPDATIRNRTTGETLEVEFEYASSCFRAHKHDPRKCDLIICWKADDQEVTLPLWVVSEAGWETRQPRRALEMERDAAYWRWRALDAERRVAEAPRPAARGPAKSGVPFRYCEVCNYTAYSSPAWAGHCHGGPHRAKVNAVPARDNGHGNAPVSAAEEAQ